MRSTARRTWGGAPRGSLTSDMQMTVELYLLRAGALLERSCHALRDRRRQDERGDARRDPASRELKIRRTGFTTEHEARRASRRSSTTTRRRLLEEALWCASTIVRVAAEPRRREQAAASGRIGDKSLVVSIIAGRTIDTLQRAGRARQRGWLRCPTRRRWGRAPCKVG